MLRRLLLGLAERIDNWFDVDLGDLDGIGCSPLCPGVCIDCYGRPEEA